MTNEDIIIAFVSNGLQEKDREGVLSVLLDRETNELQDAFRDYQENSARLTGWQLPTQPVEVICRQLGLEQQPDGSFCEVTSTRRCFWSRLAVLGPISLVFAYLTYYSGWVQTLVPDSDWRLLISSFMLVSSWGYSRSKAKDRRPVWGTVWEAVSTFSLCMAIAFYVNSVIAWFGTGFTLSSTAQSIVWLFCWFCGYGMATNALETGFGFFEKCVALQWGWREQIGNLYFSFIFLGGLISGAFTVVGCLLATWLDPEIMLWAFLYSLPIAITFPCVAIIVEGAAVPELPKASAVLRHIAATLIVALSLCLVLWFIPPPPGTETHLAYYCGAILLPILVLFMGSGATLMSDTEWAETKAEARVVADPFFVFLLSICIINSFVTQPIMPIIGGTVWHILYSICVIAVLATVTFAAYRGYFRPLTDRLVWSWYGRMLMAVLARNDHRAASLKNSLGYSLSGFRRFAETVAFNIRYRAMRPVA